MPDRPKSTQSRRWTTLCRIDEIEPGRAKYVEFDGRAYSVVRKKRGDDETDNDCVWIFDDACPHAGASMSYGSVQDQCFVCPVHQWAFALNGGRNPDNPAIRLPQYPCRVFDGEVQIGQENRRQESK